MTRMTTLALYSAALILVVASRGRAQNPNPL